MLSHITRKTVALAVQLGGVVVLATVSMLRLHSDSALFALGAYAFIAGCLLEAQSISRAELTEPDSAKLPEFLGVS
jgi:hypothetical protein